jgi:WW domain-binding protein 4
LTWFLIIRRDFQAAQAAYTLDLGSGRASTSTSTLTPPPAAPKKPPPKPSDPYQNYSTAESLGFVDTEAARLVAEAELKRSEGRMGDWSTVISIPKPPPPQPTPIASETTEPEAHPPIPEPEPSWRSLSNKKVGDGLRELYDPAGLIKVKIKPEQVEPPELAGVRSSSSGGGWTKTGWNTTDVVVDVKPVTEEDTRGAKEEERSDGVKVEESEGRAKLEEEPPADEPQPPPEGGLFKKRKAPSGTVGRGAKRKL